MSENKNETQSGSFSKDEIEVFMTALAEGFEKRDRKEYGHAYREYFNEDRWPEGKPPTPEHFDLFWPDDDRKMSAVVSIIVDQLNVPKDNAWRVRYIYKNYKTFERFLAGLCVKTEGGACSSDRSRWLVRNYLKKQITGEYEKLEEDAWYAPKYKTIEAWFHLMDVYPGFQNAHNIVELPTAIANLVKIYENLSEDAKSSDNSD